jgi:hypothetical protein
MIRTTRTQVPETTTPTLAQQQVDFTAEGSPPPGHVATSAPLGAPQARKQTPARNGSSTKNHRSHS